MKKIELKDIKNPNILKKISDENIDYLIEEARKMILTTCKINGGHNGANTSILETTVGLLKTFDANKDIIIYDVGHNCYSYKIFTDRADRFYTLRNIGGIKGFQDIFESKYDHINQGNAGTALSNSLGMAICNEKKDKEIVTVIGDSSFGNGTVYEFFNHSIYIDRPLIVVFNDNAASIGPVIGDLQGWKNDENTNIDDKLPKWAKIFNFEYLGPVNGHDWKAVAKLSEEAKKLTKLGKKVIMHVKTEKGHGMNYEGKNHGGAITHATLRPLDHSKWSKKVWPIVREEMIKNDKIDVVTSAMLYPTGYNNLFSDSAIKNVGANDFEIQSRIYNVGIAETHATSLSAGIALGGRLPLLVFESPFLRRGFDQLLHDIAIVNIHCVIQVNDIGTIENGNTHHGFYDFPMLNLMPNTHILAASNEDEMKYIFKVAFGAQKGIWAIRTEKFIEKYQEKLSTNTSNLSLVKPKWLITNSKTNNILVIASGQMFAKARDIVEKNDLDINLANAIWQKPLDEEFVKSMLQEYKKVILLEDNVQGIGLDSIMANYIDTTKIEKWMYPMNHNLTFGEEESVRALFGLDYKNVEDRLKKEVKKWK